MASISSVVKRIEFPQMALRERVSGKFIQRPGELGRGAHSRVYLGAIHLDGIAPVTQLLTGSPALVAQRFQETRLPAAFREQVLSRSVAIKMIPDISLPSKRERAERAFRREVNVFQYLNGFPAEVTGIDPVTELPRGKEHVVGFIGEAYVDGQEAIVMEHLSGPTLSQHLRQQGGKLSWEGVYPILRGMLEGMYFLHEMGVVHRDLKPGNIILRGEDQVPTLFDLGLAAHLVPQYRPFVLRIPYVLAPRCYYFSETAAGTSAYMAPEQIVSSVLGGRGEKLVRVDQRIDQFATGVVLYEMMEGRLPFVRMEIRHPQLRHWKAILYDKPRPFLVKWPWKLARIFHRLVAKRAGARYNHVGSVIRAIDRIKPTGWF